MANPRVKSSCVAGEVRASVVAALLAARRAQVLPTWRVRSAATELGVSVRTVWRWLEVAESEDRLGRKSRPCFAVGQDDLVELAYYRGNVSALRVARIAEGTPTPSIGAFVPLSPGCCRLGGRLAWCRGNEPAGTSTRICRVHRVGIATIAGRLTTRSWRCMSVFLTAG